MNYYENGTFCTSVYKTFKFNGHVKSVYFTSNICTGSKSDNQKEAQIFRQMWSSEYFQLELKKYIFSCIDVSSI